MAWNDINQSWRDSFVQGHSVIPEVQEEISKALQEKNPETLEEADEIALRVYSEAHKEADEALLRGLHDKLRST